MTDLEIQINSNNEFKGRSEIIVMMYCIAQESIYIV